MNCWYCGASIKESKSEKLSFRAFCEKCNRDQHCCKNCIYYKPGMANDCSVPGTDWIADREKFNFCEEFSPLGKKMTQSSSDARKKFDSLFK